MDEMNSGLVNEWPPVVHFDPGKLTDLATVSFVAAILHNKVLHMRQYGWQKFYDHALDLAQVSIPNVLLGTIDQLIKNMEKHRALWWTYHKFVFFEQFPADDMIDWLDRLIWLHDGAIDYTKTAIEMLNDDRVPNVRKFQLACAYCFANDVEFWKKTLTKEEICYATRNYRECDDEILNYWGARLSNRSARYSIEDVSSVIDSIIDTFEYCNEVLAMEYFLNQLENVKRFLKIQSIIVLNMPSCAKWYYLPKLTGPELDCLIGMKSLEIMDALVENPRFFEYTISIWKRMVKLIDDETLVKIIHHINCLDPVTYLRSYTNPLLWEIWLTTSEHQKKVIVDQRTCDFTEEMDDLYYEYYYSPNFPLILEVLSRFDQERRYEYFSKHWCYLVVGQLDNRNFIHRLMKLCFPNDQQIETFKSTIMIDYDSIVSSCEYLIINGRATEISTYLEFCCSDQHLIHDLKKEIMSGAPKADIFHFLFEYSNPESLADFHHYLDDIFTKDESEEFLADVITDPESLESMSDILSKKLQQVIQFVEKFISSEKLLANVKHCFFEQFRCEKFERRSVFLDLMAWCCDGNKALVDEEFKNIQHEYEASDMKMKKLDSPVYITFYEAFARLFDDHKILMEIESLKN